MIPANLCNICTRQFKDDVRKCDAFPDGIPDVIYDGGFDHHNEFDGDKGLTFIPLKLKKVYNDGKYD